MSVRDATAKRRQNVRNAPLGNNLSTKHAHRPRTMRPRPILTELAPSRKPPERGPRSELVRAAHVQSAQAHLRTRAPPAARRPDRPRARSYPQTRWPRFQRAQNRADPRPGSVPTHHRHKRERPHEEDGRIAQLAKPDPNQFS